MSSLVWHRWKMLMGSVLAALAIGFSTIMPAHTQAAPVRLSCTTTIEVGDSALSTFRIEGSPRSRVYTVRYTPSRIVNGPSRVTVNPGSTVGVFFVDGVRTGIVRVDVQQNQFRTSEFIPVVRSA